MAINAHARPGRTTNQKRADRFDSDLFVLIGIAEKAAEEKGGDFGRWRAIRTRLIQARLLVRDMMHPDDVKATQ